MRRVKSQKAQQKYSRKWRMVNGKKRVLTKQCKCM